MWSPADLFRALLAALAVVGALVAPWWLPAACMLLLSLRFDAWEVPLIGLWVDLLWLPTPHSIPWFTLYGIAVVWLAAPLRKQLLL